MENERFYCKEEDVGKTTRLEASFKNLQELNPYCEIIIEKTTSNEIPKEIILKYDLVIFTEDHIPSLINYNKFCRENNIYFVAGECRGVFGSIFTDYGDNFVCVDTTVEKEASGIITDIKIDEKGDCIIYTNDSENRIDTPNLSDGDFILLSNLPEYLNELNNVEKQITRVDAFTFNVGKISVKEIHSVGSGRYVHVKKPKKIAFQSLEKSLGDFSMDKFLLYNFSKFTHPQQILVAFKALNEFKIKNKRLPKSYNEEDAKMMIEIAQTMTENKELLNEKIIRALSYTSRGNLNPICTFFGGLIAQEAQKAVTGKYHPIYQWFNFEDMNCLSLESIDESDFIPKNCRYDSQIAVLGAKFQTTLGNLKYFLVGCGALGCEYCKNFAMVGLCCGEKGKLTITDMDEIETSNLSRQFLFRDRHVGKMKSTCAGEITNEMNKSIKIKAMQDRVGCESENVFNDSFWGSLDGIMNALDNLEARRYVDSRSVFYRKPLFESGTLGPAAHTQVIIPRMTINYSSQQDAPNQGFPECTIHVYPNVVEHTISWAKRLFTQTFFESTNEVNLYVRNPNKYVDENGMNVFSMETIHNFLIRQKPKDFQNCIEIGKNRFEELFNYNIQNILLTHPPNEKTESGGSFWSGNKRCPKDLSFNINDKTHIMFVEKYAILLAMFYGIKIEDSANTKKVCEITKVRKYVPAPIRDEENEDKTNENKVKTTEELEKEEKIEKENILKQRKYLGNIIGELEKHQNEFKELIGFEFEKNDDLHMSFVTLASNLRARCYGIPEIDEHQTKGIAGNIVPAMITTTAIATGLMMLEVYKFHQKKGIEDHVNAFLNIGVPVFVLNQPMEPPKIILDKYTVWDRILVQKFRDISLSEFIDSIEKKCEGIKVLSLAYSGNIIYNAKNKSMSKEQREYRLKYPLKKLTEHIIKGKIPKTSKFIQYVCVVEKDGKVLDDFVSCIYTIKINKKLLRLKKKKAQLNKKK